MTPYYDEDGITIYHGDAEDVLPSLSDVDLIFTSPPYNLSDNGPSRGTEFGRLAEGYDGHNDAMPHDQYVNWQHRILRACWSTLSNTGAILYNHKPIVRGNHVRLPLELNPGLPLRQIIIWDRGSGFTRTHWHFVPRHEWIMVLAREGFRLANLTTDDVWPVTFDTRNPHPAPFPVGLPARAIEATAPSLVVDPFAGSGTTLVAAKAAGVKAVGIDKSKAYCDMAAERLTQSVLPFG